MLSVDLLRKIIARYQSLQPDELAKQIYQYELIQQKTANREERLKDLREEYEAEVARISSERLCDHHFSESRPDPAGGSDRCDVCLICGEVF